MTYGEFKTQYHVRLNPQQEAAVRQRFFSQLGWALFGVSLVVACFEFGIEYSSGRGNIRHTAINCLKGFLAVSLFSTSGWWLGGTRSGTDQRSACTTG